MSNVRIDLPHTLSLALAALAVLAPVGRAQVPVPDSLVSHTTVADTAASDTVAYHVSFPSTAHHEARIRIVYTGVQGDTLRLRMSRASPGRYSLHEFAKNVYAVEIEAPGEIRVTRPSPHGWDVTGQQGPVRVTYTLFGNRVDGTYTAVDRSHAHLNMPATFMWARGLEDRPILVRFQVPPESGWRVATQLAPTDDPYAFTASDLDYFLDSPTELSAFDLREWTVRSRGRAYTFRIAAHTIDAPADLDRYQEMVRNVVREQIGVFGELPALDHGTYTFLADYLPWAEGDGMEHRNSTVLTSSSSLRENPVGLVGTVAHEFFHAWNVERIRPASLEPFDFEGANMSRELWFGEGFTSYYDDLTLRRAGILDDRTYARRIGGSIGRVVNSPARRFRSPVEMSMMALFTDDASFLDPTNLENTFLSYYTWGSVVGLGLDLTLRSRFSGIDLDDYMRLVWRRHGEPFVPYTVEDLETALADLTGDPAFARDFFSRYVRGRQVPPMGELLGHAGIVLRKVEPGRAVLGAAPLRFGSEGGAVVAGETTMGTPLYEAGVGRGDRILAVNGTFLGGARILATTLAQKRPGDPVVLTVDSGGRTRRVRVTLVEDPRVEAVPFEDAGRRPTEEMMRFRRDWLGSRAR